MNLTPELQMCVDLWKNEDAYNDKFHADLTKAVNRDPVLKAHRDWTEANQYGFGDRAFGWVWKMLVDQMPSEFSFLEVGVFKGQILSLVALIAQSSGKIANITGVTTLTNTPDVRCKYPPGDYLGWIHEIYKQFSVPFDHTKLVIGKSADAHVLEHLAHQTFDCVYIDGSHDYADVVADIRNYAPKVKVGGFLIMDDSSIGRINVGSCWSGLEDVARAVKDHLDNDPRFKFLFCVGHLNLFYRLKA